MQFLELGVLAVFTALAGHPNDVTGIMVRVAMNQQTARAARANYLYRQVQDLRMRRPNGKIAREQHAEYVVTPGTTGAEKTLAKFEGKYQYKGKYVSYDKPGYKYKDLDIDGDLIKDMSEDMMNDGKSQDGIARDLFPLTADEQRNYEFRLVGKEEYRGRPVYRVAFVPRPGSDGDEDGIPWKGEALIDVAEYQPVLVTTEMAYKIPTAVKVLLGTDIRGLGFSVSYRKFGDGVWFPISYGGEFEVRGVFFYKRNISVAMQNLDFQKTDVKSTLEYATERH